MKIPGIFISYSREDEDIAHLFYDYLIRLGYQVFFDLEAGIAGGENWTSTIQNALESADWVIVLLSPSSVRSLWIKQEIYFAYSSDKRLVPVLIKDVDTTEIPIVLQTVHWLDARKNLPDALQRLGEVIKRSIELEPSNAPPSIEKIEEESERVLQQSTASDRIFIAYSHFQRHLAKELSDLLYQNGKPNFYDAKIKAGAVWRQTIQKALDDATHLVVIWTPEAAESDEVEREVSYALAKRKVIVPILSKEIPELPYHLHGLHYIVLEEDVSKIETDLLKAIAQFSDDDIWQ